MSGPRSTMVKLFGPSEDWSAVSSFGKPIGSLREFGQRFVACFERDVWRDFNPTKAHRAFLGFSVDGGTIERVEPFQQWLKDRNAMLVRRYGSVIPRKLRRVSMKALRREWLGLLEGERGLTCPESFDQPDMEFVCVPLDEAKRLAAERRGK